MNRQEKNSMKKEPVEKRFEVIHNESLSNLLGYQSVNYAAILKDRQTGVLYLLTRSGDSGGLTPLLDAEGKPVMEKSNE